jgi:hypothetical protein
MQQGQFPQGPVAYPPARRTNSMAIVSLVAGIAAFVLVPLVAGVVAVITGHVARGQIRRTGEDGNGLALAGLILGYLNLALAVLAILFVVILVIIGIGASRSQGG